MRYKISSFFLITVIILTFRAKDFDSACVVESLHGYRRQTQHVFVFQSTVLTT